MFAFNTAQRVKFDSFHVQDDAVLKAISPQLYAEQVQHVAMRERLIHAQLSERRHYLYDSFQSFRPEEIEDEIRRGVNTKAFWEGFKNTSVAVVLQGTFRCEKRKAKEHETGGRGHPRLHGGFDEFREGVARAGEEGAWAL